MYSIHIRLVEVLSIDQNVSQINYNRDVQLFDKDLIDVVLKISWYIEKIEEHDLILEVTIPSIKNRLPFVTFLDPHLMVYTSEVLLYTLLSLT